MDGFKAQDTTMGSFHDAERMLYDRYVGKGYSNEVARTIAHTFTQYMLGYVTAEGAAQFIRGGGASEEDARALARLFRDVKRRASEPAEEDEVDHTHLNQRVLHGAHS